MRSNRRTWEQIRSSAKIGGDGQHHDGLPSPKEVPKTLNFAVAEEQGVDSTETEDPPDVGEGGRFIYEGLSDVRIY